VHLRIDKSGIFVARPRVSIHPRARSGPLGQRSWSKALVPHGAHGRAPLAEVLGVPAGDLVVRDRAQ
jgi:hypothetical protein